MLQAKDVQSQPHVYFVFIAQYRELPSRRHLF